MRAPLRLIRPKGRALRHIKAVQRRFHVRAFGEELARVNLDLKPSERRECLAWMRNYVRHHGGKLPPNYSVAWLLKVEEELDREQQAKPS